MLGGHSGNSAIIGVFSCVLAYSLIPAEWYIGASTAYAIIGGGCCYGFSNGTFYVDLFTLVSNSYWAFGANVPEGISNEIIQIDTKKHQP